mmetsp:Transcript_2114/g.7656  ORF Transcript_2114/g.7656 Transcript_2114/m.7656 type:complete len:203 (+) Transcript_2114:2339-2947(+)|eukprot:CAMPEP_0117447950 /NCGR_PEP_ID=MMETSP0759-20121206/7141_1 /TAXON_ID=63605 /ORGANISM="Percolomonas cosmopolitus, Strain WS" /LENGTH=202 /DNA_ID=CAMNT_0005240305 /DNA_START=547 /DNA_END=1155 /DNA_ORIENTATION=-
MKRKKLSIKKNSKKFLKNFFGHSRESSADFQQPETDPLTGEPILQQQDEPANPSHEQQQPPQPPPRHSSYSANINDVQPNTNFLQQQDPYSYNPPNGQPQVDMNDREARESQIIKTLLKEYFGIVRKNISDAVPKSIMHFMVNMTKLNLQSELVQNLYKSELFEELLQENDEIAQKRKATQKMLTILLRAQDIINEVRDLKV